MISETRTPHAPASGLRHGRSRALRSNHSMASVAITGSMPAGPPTPEPAPARTGAVLPADPHSAGEGDVGEVTWSLMMPSAWHVPPSPAGVGVLRDNARARQRPPRTASGLAVGSRSWTAARRRLSIRATYYRVDNHETDGWSAASRRLLAASRDRTRRVAPDHPADRVLVRIQPVRCRRPSRRARESRCLLVGADRTGTVHIVTAVRSVGVGVRFGDGDCRPHPRLHPPPRHRRNRPHWAPAASTPRCW